MFMELLWFTEEVLEKCARVVDLEIFVDAYGLRVQDLGHKSTVFTEFISIW